MAERLGRPSADEQGEADDGEERGSHTSPYRCQASRRRPPERGTAGVSVTAR
jgi:hypothetical protein